MRTPDHEHDPAPAVEEGCATPESSGKQPYRKPKVEEFGSVLELTAGAGAVAGDTVVTLSVTAC